MWVMCWRSSWNHQFGPIASFRFCLIENSCNQLFDAWSDSKEADVGVAIATVQLCGLLMLGVKLQQVRSQVSIRWTVLSGDSIHTPPLLLLPLSLFSFVSVLLFFFLSPPFSSIPPSPISVCFLLRSPPGRSHVGWVGLWGRPRPKDRDGGTMMHTDLRRLWVHDITSVLSKNKETD